MRLSEMPERKLGLMASRKFGILLFFVGASIVLTAADRPKFVASSPPPDRALVYVYRHSATFSKGGALAVFVNKDYLAFLPYSSYAVREVPPGKVVVTATSRMLAYPPPRPPSTFTYVITNGHSAMKSFAPCSALDWQHVGEAPAEFIAQCEAELRQALPELQASAQGVIFVLNEVLKEQVGGYLKSRIALEVQAGKIYYIRLSFGMSDVAEMKEVDTAVGAKEIRGLRLTVK
jgi:hypothetical protein